LPIDVEWQDEDGETLARYDGPLVTVTLVERADPTSCCLRFIDPWGNTIFNQQQLPVLVHELEAIESRTPDGQREAIHALLAFLRPACDQVHTYIKFIGD
jgi:hypothetical protein